MDLLNPQNCLCDTVRKAARNLTQHYDTHLRPAGVRVTQFSLLAALAAADEEGWQLGELAAQLEIDRTTLTRNLAIADREGWIRDLKTKDGRARCVSLSAKGRRAYDQALPLWSAAQQELLGRLGDRAMSKSLKSARRLSA